MWIIFLKDSPVIYDLLCLFYLISLPMNQSVWCHLFSSLIFLFSYYKCFIALNSDCVTNLSHFSSVTNYSGKRVQVWLKERISGSINGWAIYILIAFRNIRKPMKNGGSITTSIQWAHIFWKYWTVLSILSTHGFLHLIRMISNTPV